jgi:hypothetical protein
VNSKISGIWKTSKGTEEISALKDISIGAVL